MPLENLLGPVGDLYCFSNTFRMLVHFEGHEIFQYGSEIRKYPETLKIVMVDTRI